MASYFDSAKKTLTSKLYSLPGDLQHGVKQLGPSLEGFIQTYNPYSSNASDTQQFEAGHKLADIYHDEWEAIHKSNVKNAKKAAECDTKIVSLKTTLETRLEHVNTLKLLVSQLPKINKELASITKSIGDLEASFSEVEVSLLALEDTIDAVETQKKQTEERRKLDEYREKKNKEFQELSERITSEYAKKKSEVEFASSLYPALVKSSANSQNNGQSVKKDFLTVPSRRDPDHSLETVDLNTEEINLEYYDEELEAFLRDGEDKNADILSAISPLPKDDDESLEKEVEAALSESKSSSSKTPSKSSTKEDASLSEIDLND